MGSMNTRLSKDDSSMSYTPIKPDQLTRTIPDDFDPRSPAAAFNRTPIQVKADLKSIVDPRSPTNEIERTPIYGVKHSHVQMTKNGEQLFQDTFQIIILLLSRNMLICVRLIFSLLLRQYNFS